MAVASDVKYLIYAGSVITSTHILEDSIPGLRKICVIKRPGLTIYHQLQDYKNLFAKELPERK